MRSIRDYARGMPRTTDPICSVCERKHAPRWCCSACHQNHEMGYCSQEPDFDLEANAMNVGIDDEDDE